MSSGLRAKLPPIMFKALGKKDGTFRRLGLLLGESGTSVMAFCEADLDMCASIVANDENCGFRYKLAMTRRRLRVGRKRHSLGTLTWFYFCDWIKREALF